MVLEPPETHSFKGIQETSQNFHEPRLTAFAKTVNLRLTLYVVVANGGNYNM